ncbi:Scd6-like Sm domain-containing protein [Xylariaceae sp. FL0804]|nr:Scd6-like Sm domain-containing protein [Xylariaceae sp. FL0804]
MSEFLGSRISLISKSDIRYSGILHEINSDQSTVSLENVKSFGTEGRRQNPDEEIAPSDQIYEYIVFRGSDVKDLRIEQTPAAPKENQPPKVPDDPAIVGARTRGATSNVPPGPGHQGPGSQGPIPSNYGQNPYPPNFYPPPGQWGRGVPPGPPGPGQGFNGMPYPPPQGWFPPGQGFPPGGPPQWNQFGYPPGPTGPPGAPGAPGQGMRGTPQQDNRPAPIGASVDKQRPTFGQPPVQPASRSAAPTPPIESKPTAAEVKATAESLGMDSASTTKPEMKAAPSGPRSNRVTPAKTGPQVTAATATVRPSTEQGSGAPSAAALRDATKAAKAAVAVAMAKLDNPAAVAGPEQAAVGGNAMDNLTKKVSEMRVNANRTNSGRGRGRGGRGGAQGKVEVPDADFDFQIANAKFNKQDLVKEAIADSPTSDALNGAAPEASEFPESAVPAAAYNKTRSFFDNISSEARERAENGGQKPGGREWRGEEQRKNMETFGQGSVDGGYRGGYRGRGRGRGNSRGRGPRGRGQGRGGSYPQAAIQ